MQLGQIWISMWSDRMGRCCKEAWRLRRASGRTVGEMERERERFVICSLFHLLPCHASCRGGNTPWCLRETEREGWARWRGGWKQIEAGKRWTGWRRIQRKVTSKKRQLFGKKGGKSMLSIAYNWAAKSWNAGVNYTGWQVCKYEDVPARLQITCPAFAIHIFARWLTSDKAGDQELFPFPLSLCSFSLPPHPNRNRGEQARHDGSTASAEVISLANAAAPQMHAHRFDMYSVSKPHLIHFAVSPPFTASRRTRGEFRVHETDKTRCHHASLRITPEPLRNILGIYIFSLLLLLKSLPFAFYSIRILVHEGQTFSKASPHLNWL